MPIVHYWPERRKRDFSKIRIVCIGALMILLVAVVCITIHDRGPSEDEVNGWLAELPAHATRDQVKSLFAKRKISWDERPLDDGSGLTYINGCVACEGDRAISIIIRVDKDGRAEKAYAKEGYRGP